MHMCRLKDVTSDSERMFQNFKRSTSFWKTIQRRVPIAVVHIGHHTEITTAQTVM